MPASTSNDAHTAAAVAVALVSGFAFFLLLLLVRNNKRAMHKRIVAGDSKLNSFLTSALQPLVDRYTPTWWANGHFQIVLTFLVPQASIKYTREVLQLRDGGHTSLDWAIEASGPPSKHGKPLQDDSPILIVLHGLTGCSDAMRSLCAEALGHGYRSVVFNKRGHGGMPLATPKLQAFGCVEDLNQAIDQIEKRYPSSKLYGIGFSAGSGLLCSYFGETGTTSRLAAGVLVSPGYDAFDIFCRGLIHPFYDFLMAHTLKKFLRGHERQLASVVDVPRALRASSIREFDELVFMKMHGYDSLEAYWANNNPMRAIGNIARPTLCINAWDDPVCTKESIRYEQFEKNPLGMLIETERGSHCAFYEGHLFLKCWANEVAMEYLDRVRDYDEQQQLEMSRGAEELVCAPKA
ncbi:hypothetical protein Gpo141_00007792 [Globisporangium polare]